MQESEQSEDEEERELTQDKTVRARDVVKSKARRPGENFSKQRRSDPEAVGTRR